jgi:hypothetical protein
MIRSNVVKALLAVALSATAAQAQTSNLNIVGTVNLYQLVAGPGGNLVIDFVPPSNAGIGVVYTPPGTTGNTGVFAPLPTSLPGVNLDFVFGPGAIPPTTTTPVAFLQMGGYTFTATNFGPGNYPNTPLTVIPVGNTVFALLSVQGYVNGPGLAPNTPFIGGYSAQVPGSLASVVSAIETNIGPNGGIGAVSVSATFTTVSAVPEPATVTLMATGFVALVGMGYARRRNHA